MDVSGSRIAIGAIFNEDNSGNINHNKGHVRVYDYKIPTTDEWNNGNVIKGNDTTQQSGEYYWTQVGNDIDGESNGDRFGHVVVMSNDGSIIAISSRNHDSNKGHVRVYDYKIPTTDEWNNGNVIKGNDTTQQSGEYYWTQIGNDIDGESQNDYSGTSLAMNESGNKIAIGAPYHDSDKGHVRVYESDTTNGWGQLGDIDGQAQGDRFGESIAMNSDGTIIVIGSSDKESSPGFVRVYEYDTTNGWEKVGSDINGTTNGDEFGKSVALDASGSKIVVGAPTMMLVMCVFIIEIAINTTVEPIGWSKVGSDIIGEASGDKSGISVAMSSDGNRIAIGSAWNDGNGNNSGHARVYNWNNITSSWDKVGDNNKGEAQGDNLETQ